jgi:sugar (pentulose or hexulose) kinase
MGLFIGIDLGTSGCRAMAINDDREVIAEYAIRIPLPQADNPGCSEQDADIWWQSLLQVMQGLSANITANEVRAISIDGTSSTLLVCDQQGQPLSAALMYNDNRSQHEAELVRLHAPPDSAAQGPGSSLAKLLHLLQRHPDARHALHQSDWLMGQLSGRFGISDENNCLKLGFRPGDKDWPAWIDALGIKRAILPRVYPPGTAVAVIKKALASMLGIPDQTRIVTGTTDSTAAFLATGANTTGQAVTSLGSTLVTKIIAEVPIYSREYGIYSHRIFDHWLVGGASNSGGAALLQCFSTQEMEELTPLLDPEHDTGLDYYPLPRTGERFPHADPRLEPRMPAAIPANRSSRAIIFQGLLEGISKIEAQAYQLLSQLGAPYPDSVLSVGGGAVNPAWNQIRQRYLGVKVSQAIHHEAAYGAALLALHGNRQAS